MRSLVVFILISASIAFVYSAKTGGLSATLDAILPREDRPATDVKPPGATHRQKIVADAETQEAHKQIQSEQKVVVNPMLKKVLEADEGDVQMMGKDLKTQALHALIRIKALSTKLTIWCVASGAIILLFMLARGRRVSPGWVTSSPISRMT